MVLRAAATGAAALGVPKDRVEPDSSPDVRGQLAVAWDLLNNDRVRLGVHATGGTRLTYLPGTPPSPDLLGSAGHPSFRSWDAIAGGDLNVSERLCLCDDGKVVFKLRETVGYQFLRRRLMEDRTPVGDAQSPRGRNLLRSYPLAGDPEPSHLHFLELGVALEAHLPVTRQVQWIFAINFTWEADVSLRGSMYETPALSPRGVDGSLAFEEPSRHAVRIGGSWALAFDLHR